MEGGWEGEHHGQMVARRDLTAVWMCTTVNVCLCVCVLLVVGLYKCVHKRERLRPTPVLLSSWKEVLEGGFGGGGGGEGAPKPNTDDIKSAWQKGGGGGGGGWWRRWENKWAELSPLVSPRRMDTWRTVGWGRGGGEEGRLWPRRIKCVCVSC